MDNPDSGSVGQIEKLIVKLDSQILNAADLCAERYRLEHRENWRPNFKAPALERGGTMHKMLDHYYAQKKKGRGKLEDHHKLVEECLVIGRLACAETDIEVEDFEENDVRTFQDYILRWQYDGWEILDVEQPFSFVLYEDDVPLEFEGDLYSGLCIIYEGIIDLRVIDPKQGEIVVDTKTESRKSNPFILSNQFQGYEMAFNVPVVVNKVGYQKTLEAKEKFRRLTHLTGPVLLEEWRQDCIHTVREIIGWHNTETFKRNRTSCDKYSGCIYQRVCKEPPEVREFKLMSWYHKGEPWDPYKRDKDKAESTPVEA